MKKNGYTILELVTVIAILSIAAVILIPKINSLIKTSRADQLEEVRENVMHAADVYLNNKCGYEQHKVLVENGNVRLYLIDLNSCGLIDNKIYNPMNNEYFNIENEYVDAYIDQVGMIDYKLSF